MQEIIVYATANEVLARVRDRANAKAATPPTLARGCGFRLKIRLFANSYDDTPYPIANLANITSWAFVMDSDWDSATPFKVVADAGEIAVGEVQDQYEGEVVTYTEAVVPVSETNTEELAAWLGSDEGKDGLNAELIGYDGTGEEAFVLQIKGFSVRNRLGSVGDPTPIPSEYLTADQVRALIASGAALQFSPDGATWKDTQEEGDIYLRFRSASDASAAWSPAIALPRGVNGSDGASSYIYVAYASDSMGSNFSMVPTSGLKYRAELHTNIPLESPNASDFSGVTWVKYIGDDGAGAGDMLKAVYDLDDDGVVDSAEKLATARKIGAADFDGTGDISLSDMGAQPALPTNGNEGQFLQKTASGVKWATPPSAGGGSGASWGQITGDIQTQSDLKAALDAKADSSALTHYAPKADSLAGYGITDAYTKEEVNAKVSAVYRYKGSVATYAELPTEGNTVGDVWNVAAADEEHGIKAGDNVAWNGSAWDALSGTVDLTPYATKGELSAGLDGKSDIDHLHTGKYVPLEANNHIPGSYFVRGGLSAGGNLGSNGYIDARLGFKKNQVSLDDIYAAKSHTHAMGDITPDPLRLAIQAMEGAALEVSPGKAYSATLSADATLSATGGEDGYRQEAFLDVNPGAYSLTPGNGITFAQDLTASKVNHCRIVWHGTSARLLVDDVTDAPASGGESGGGGGET